MTRTPTLPNSAVIRLTAIHDELTRIRARYARTDLKRVGYIFTVEDVILMHEYVWDAVALLRDSFPIAESHATLLAHLYQTRRDGHTGAITLAGLGEMIDLLQTLVGRGTLQ